MRPYRCVIDCRNVNKTIFSILKIQTRQTMQNCTRIYSHELKTHTYLNQIHIESFTCNGFRIAQLTNEDKGLLRLFNISISLN